MLATVFTKTIRDRWKGSVIGAVTLGLFLLMGMAVYRNIDLTIYTDLPEALRALINIPADADIGSLGYGAIYSSYGALTLAAIAISMGSASIAGEERNGTIGLLLGNPRSRTYVLVSKTASLVLLVALGAVILWGAGQVVPAILDVDIAGMHVGALVLHMFVNALFYGFMALAIGAWTGRGGFASGVTAGVMVVAFFTAGLFPVVEVLENLARVSPWYYFEASQPVVNGINSAHLGVLLSGVVLFGAVALIGINRRDLRGQNSGVTLLDRLRANPRTKRVVDRLAGSTRVSHIWIKTASDHQGLLIVTAGTMFAMMGVMIGPMYSLIDDRLIDFADVFPDTLLALFGGGDMSTAEGWYQLETFGLMAPIAVMVVTVAIASRALAGEEARRTMGLLLANPIPRSRVVLEKSIAMAIYGFVVGFATFAGVAIGSVLGGLGMSPGNIAATSLLVSLLGIAFGAFALAVGAATGRVKMAIFVTVGVALGFHIWNALLPLNESLAVYAIWSPVHYYLGSDPLIEGMNWVHGLVLAALAVGFVGLAVFLFDRRDLRQTG